MDYIFALYFICLRKSRWPGRLSHVSWKFNRHAIIKPHYVNGRFQRFNKFDLFVFAISPGISVIYSGYTADGVGYQKFTKISSTIPRGLIRYNTSKARDSAFILLTLIIQTALPSTVSTLRVRQTIQSRDARIVKTAALVKLSEWSFNVICIRSENML